MKITNETDVKSVTAILHDARFMADAIAYDAKAQTFALKCWVQGLKGKDDSSVLAELKRQEEMVLTKRPRIASILWKRVTKGDASADSRIWEACQLCFSKVTDCKVHIKKKPSIYYEIVTIQFNMRDSKLKLITHHAAEINLQLGELDGALNETIETRAKWNVKPSKQSGPL